MSETRDERPVPRKTLFALKVLAAVFITAMILPQVINYLRVRNPPHLACRKNLWSLRTFLGVYADEHNRYPPADRWCDVLIQHGGEGREAFLRCPSAENGPCSYAINPHADPCSTPDVVLLFETNSGWNQNGGPELLTAKRHKRGSNVLFVNGDVRFVKAKDVPLLRWEGRSNQHKKEANLTRHNARRPAMRSEAEYWLKNMVWYHHLTMQEIQAATALTERQILALQKDLNIWPNNAPVRSDEASLLVLPYPGGRHSRIGFLEGAIDPQRETKFSVFTPWDPNSYVVVDVPEAIWSNLGLTYLAHTHIDTIWTKQGITLPKLEWNRRPDGSLDIERTLPNGIAFGVKAVPAKDAVHMEMWLENGTDQRLMDLRVQICVMPKMAAGFAEQTNENKVFTNPYVACRSTDGKRWIVTAWEGCQRPWGNEQCPCFHSDPKFPDLAPGQKHRLRGWLSFYEGEDIQAEFARIEAAGWRHTEK
jgi:hypothetical protein